MLHKDSLDTSSRPFPARLIFRAFVTLERLLHGFGEYGGFGKKSRSVGLGHNLLSKFGVLGLPATIS